MKNNIEIVIADDHSLVRKGLRQVLESQSHFQIAEAENGEEAFFLIKEKKPLIAILDVEMPKLSGFDVAKRVKDESLEVKLIFLTMFKEESVFNKAMDAGVKGYVLKENTVSEIYQCVKSVSEGNYYLSPSISDFLIRRNTRSLNPESNKSGINLLTQSEKNILKLLAKMKTNQEIADDLKISIKTVHNHRNNICEKLGLRGIHSLLKFAVENSSEL